jgi:membrane associated rhomboid family serine protease
MVVPIGDSPNPRGVPVVTYLLIAANVAVYALITFPLGSVRPAPGDPMLAEYVRVVSDAVGQRMPVEEILRQVTAYDLFVFRHGFRPGSPALADLFVSMFLHGGLLHLVGNMLFLWIYGDNVEQRLGRVRLVLWYVLTGIAATLFHTAGARQSQMPMVGASGAISGVLGFYFVWFPRNHVRLLWLLPPFVMQVVEVPARLVLGLYLVADNLLPYLIAAREGGGVAHGAHIGGFLAGLAAAWVMDRRGLATPPPEFAHAAPPSGEDASGRRSAAASPRLRGVLRARPRAARGVLPRGLALAEWLRANDHAEAALTVLRRQMRTSERARPRRGARPGRRDLLEDLGQPTAAYQHLLAALDLGPSVAAATRPPRPRRHRGVAEAPDRPLSRPPPFLSGTRAGRTARDPAPERRRADTRSDERGSDRGGERAA